MAKKKTNKQTNKQVALIFLIVHEPLRKLVHVSSQSTKIQQPPMVKYHCQCKHYYVFFFFYLETAWNPLPLHFLSENRFFLSLRWGLLMVYYYLPFLLHLGSLPVITLYSTTFISRTSICLFWIHSTKFHVKLLFSSENRLIADVPVTFHACSQGSSWGTNIPKQYL